MSVEIPKKLRVVIEGIGQVIQGSENYISAESESKKSRLEVTIIGIGDIVIGTAHVWQLRIRNHIGGTLSPNTWNALRFLHVAMHLDKDKVAYDFKSLKGISTVWGNRYVAKKLLMQELREIDIELFLKASGGYVERVQDDCDGVMTQKLTVMFANEETLLISAYYHEYRELIEEREFDPVFKICLNERPWTFMATKVLALAMLMDCEGGRRSCWY